MSEINHSDRAHSRIGASSSSRWFKCPASVPLSEGVPKTTSEYAEEGTCAHEMAEYCLENDLDAVHGIGLTFNDRRATPEMAEAVQVYLDAVKDRMVYEDDELYLEEKFHLDWIDKDLFGSNDATIISHKQGKLFVMDYKHGAGVPVEAKENSQLMYYALGAMRGLEGIFELELSIVQPRCDHPEGPIRTWTITPDRLEEYEKELKQRVKDVKEAESLADPYQLATSGSHCRFCPASGFCNTLREKSYEVARADFDDSDNSISLPSAASLTPEQLVKVMEHAKLIEGWIKGVKEHAKTLADNGHTLPGLKLVKARANRKWTHEPEVIAEFSDMFGDDIFTKKLKSPAQLEKILGKGSVDNFTTIPDTGTSLVKETDKRPAVRPTAIEDFTDI